MCKCDVQHLQCGSLTHKPAAGVCVCVQVERVQGKQKAVRIVSTGRQPRNPLWVSVKKDGPGKTGDSGESDRQHRGNYAKRNTKAVILNSNMLSHYTPAVQRMTQHNNE